MEAVENMFFFAEVVAVDCLRLACFADLRSVFLCCTVALTCMDKTTTALGSMRTSGKCVFD